MVAVRDIKLNRLTTLTAMLALLCIALPARAETTTNLSPSEFITDAVEVLAESLDGRRDELRPGDLVRVYGSLRRFSRPDNPGQRDLRRVLLIRERIGGE